MADRSLLTHHARVLLSIAHDPGARLRDIAVGLGVTDCSAYGIITDPTKAGYVVKQRDGRRNHSRRPGHRSMQAARRRRGKGAPEAGDGQATLRTGPEG